MHLLYGGNFDPFTDEWVDLVVLPLTCQTGKYEKLTKKETVKWVESRKKRIFNA